MSTNSTIAAISTGLTNSGISIIRISGSDSLNIIKKIFKTSNEIAPNKIVFGKIIKNGEVMDNVLVSYFKAPRSYTGEDICEINCHGGIEITKQILEIVLENGARLAEPGEFSKRAFLNGKMDLSKAEAVIDLINSKTKVSARIASNHLNGDISTKIKNLREELVELLAHISVSIDYPEYDYEEVENDNVINLIDKKVEEVNYLIDTYDQGRYIKDGINVAIVGKPNVGKSSLLNSFAKYEKAIVTDIPGTTRDIVEERVNIGNLILNISDSAGIRDTDDIVEKIGVEKSLKLFETADLVLYMFSPENKIENMDFEILSKIQNKGIKFIVVINKMDKHEKSIFDTFMNEFEQKGIKNVMTISVKDQIGIEELKLSIKQMFEKSDFDYEHELMITNERHRNLLKESVNYLEDAKKEIQNGMPIDIVSIGIKNATKYLGQIVGLDVSEDVTKKIFEKFCLGK